MKNQRVQVLMAMAVSLGLVLGLLTGCIPPRPEPLTFAFTATSAEPAPSVVGVEDLLTRHADGAVLPGDGAVRVIAQGGQPATVDLTPMRGSEVENTEDKAHDLIKEHIAELDTRLSKLKSSTRGLDVLGTLDSALQVTPDGGTIVVVTSFLSTVAPLDLNKAGEWITAPGRVADAIDQRHIPDASGRSIVFIGIGYPAGRQPMPGTAARTALEKLASEICQRTRAASCTIQPGPAGRRRAAATKKVPVVRFDKVTTNCVGSTALSADVLFGSNSAVLATKADQALRPIARGLAACPSGRKVDAVGHYAEVPGGGDGRALSKARARAVLKRLRQLGAPSRVLGRALGCGRSVPCQLVDNTPNGRYSEALARKNRVVELTIRTTKE